MKVVVHGLVHIDVLEAMEFYEREGGPQLAAEFFYEYERVLESIGQRPNCSRLQEEYIAG